MIKEHLEMTYPDESIDTKFSGLSGLQIDEFIKPGCRLRVV
jgi:hypothetical protein